MARDVETHAGVGGACGRPAIVFIRGTADLRAQLRKSWSRRMQTDPDFRKKLVEALGNGIGAVIVDVGEPGSDTTWATYDPDPSSLYVLADAYADNDEVVDFVIASISHLVRQRLVERFAARSSCGRILGKSNASG